MSNVTRLDGVISIYGGRIYYSPSIPEVDVNSFTLTPYLPIRAIDQVEHNKWISKVYDGNPISPSDVNTARILTVELVVLCKYAEKLNNRISTNPNHQYRVVETFVPIVYADQQELNFIEKFIIYFLQSKEVQSIPPYAFGVKNIEKILTNMIGKDSF